MRTTHSNLPSIECPHGSKWPPPSFILPGRWNVVAINMFLRWYLPINHKGICGGCVRTCIIDVLRRFYLRKPEPNEVVRSQQFFSPLPRDVERRTELQSMAHTCRGKRRTRISRSAFTITKVSISSLWSHASTATTCFWTRKWAGPAECHIPTLLNFLISTTRL